jgi:protein-S-isoprenylcysteine O-methyltransferase Ste14
MARSDFPTFFQQLKAILFLPVNGTLLVQALIWWYLGDLQFAWHQVLHYMVPALFFGGIFLLMCLLLVYNSTVLFIKEGQGTIAPWHPTQKMVVSGPYRYVRHPMISGVIFILLGESILFTSIGILGWAIFFFISNHFYFLYVEEPNLEQRFGAAYRKYEEEVPRWLPRLDPWEQEEE